MQTSAMNPEFQNPAIVVLSEAALPTARRIQSAIGGQIYGPAARGGKVDIDFDNVGERMRKLFQSGRPILALMASGIVIRLLAPVLADKLTEPPVLAVAEDGSSIIPLLGGHHGANDLARLIGQELGGHAAITTAGDLKFGIALDAPPAGYSLVNPENAKNVIANLVAGGSVDLVGVAPWLEASRLPLRDGASSKIVVTENIQEGPTDGLLYHPKTLVLGVGCERGADAAELIELCEDTLARHGLAAASVACIASIDLKADESAVHAVANHYDVEARFFTAQQLEKEAGRLENPSEVVFAETGCHGVAEGSALACVGASGKLAVPKQKSKRATAAVGMSTSPLAGDLPGRARGILFVVGIGPGSEGWRSPEVSAMVQRSTDLVGYSLYLDLLGPLVQGKTRHDFDLGREEARVHHAMELAGQGRDVALVCSGDAGIYAMATLVYELLDKGQTGDATGLSVEASRIEIHVSPGISALQAAAARAGAPLGHDFCTISLSDLLTPWPDIQRRVKAAAQGDFVIAFYNPVSKRRRTQLAYARDRLLEHRPASTPVILATNLGRDGEKVRVVPLGELNIDDVDMLTVVIVGSSESQVVRTGDGREWVYTPRGYSGKQDSVMIAANEISETKDAI